MQRQAYFEQFEFQAESRPQAVAVETAGRSITYDALNRQANRVAHALAAHGVTGGAAGGAGGGIVGLFLDPGIGYIAALLGTGKAGAAFLPLPPDLPERRLAAYLDKARCRVVVTDSANRPALEARLAAAGAEAVILEADGPAGEQPDHNPGIAVGPGDGCYVMFTSGSTGQPKAILGQQRGLSHFLRWELAEFGLGAETRGSWLAPITFDVSLRDVLVPLMAGGTVCVPAPELRSQPHRLVDWMADSRLTLVHCVPTVLRLLVRELEHRAPAEAPFPHLRHLLVAGEPLLGADVAAWRTVAGGGAELVNLYGPSETTLAKLFHRVGALSGDPRRVLPIGRPLPNTAVLILNQGRACAAGEIGEIHIRTPYRSLGYLGDPELTAAAFVQNPLSPDKPDVIYRTGDLGRLLPDGTVECLGRQDNQVKISGIRIELAEVEAALRQVPGVAQAACAVHAGADQRPLLAGYYVRADGSSDPLPADTVKAALDRILPAGMQPHTLIALADLPTTISGKLNRKALPRPEALYYQESGYVPAETATEKALAAVWNGLFGIADAGVTTRFHAFGGDSLRAIRAVLEIYQTCGVEVALKDFFANSTIRELAALIDRTRAGSPSAAAPKPIARVPDAPSHPASPAQARLWRLDRMGIAPTAYNLPEAYELRGPVDAAALEQAFRTLIRRHESLRTSFREEDGQARQVVHAAPPWRLETIDLRRHARPEEEAHRLAAGNREHVFDLETGPLLHAVLARLPDGDGDGAPRHVFLFNIHHIVSDVWSLGVLVRELAAVYAALTQGRDPDLPPLPIQQRDATAWQAGRLADGALEADRRYWLDRLGGPLPVLELPADRPRPPVQTFNGTTHRLRLPAEATGRLLDLAEAHGATLFATLTALTKALLHRYSGQRDIIVGSPVAGRDHPDLDGQIGYLVNTLALRDRVEPETPFAGLLAAVGRTVADGVAHQSYPFDTLVGELDLARDMSRSPVFDVMVVVQTFEAIDLALDGAAARPFGPENAWNFSRYDLVFHFQTDGGELVLDLNYNRDLFDAARIAALCGHFTALAEGAALAPHTPVGALPLLSGPERAAIAGFAAGPAADRPRLSMAALLSEVAARHPGRPALVDAARSLDHAALEAATDRLARLLVAHGLEPRDRVAVLANRSVESVVALLAILKAGAVYVPLDPDYPAARLAAMLERAGCRLVLVDRPGDESALPPGSPPALAVAPVLEPGTAVPDLPLPAVAPDEVAYIIFTSGSTGQPKAVMVEHAGFVNMALGQIEAFGLGAGDRVLQFASPSFDASLANLFMALFAGGAVVLPDKAVIESVPRFLEFLAASGTTVATLPPTYLRALDRAAMPTLKVLITAGEAAPVADLTHYADRLRAFNAYGPTEASVCATIHRVSGADAALVRVPIGRPLPNTSLHILDGAGQAVPVGVPGEVHLGGAGLARGYRGDEAQTAARFVTAAWGERLYRTGDLACWRPDGTVDFLGRADEQVKISGHRIELGEIEEALRGVPGVRDGAVAAVTRTDGSQALAAYYCPEARVELWPSVAEFFVYDDVAYSSMAGDEGRNRRYRDAFARHLPGRTVVDIGTGPFAILARLALEAGARKVYAIDLLESTARKARETVARLGLSDRIEVIHGDAQSIALPEPVDFCISEIVGAIGGSEGAAKIINGARRFLTDPARMLPQRSLTRIAAVSLPEGSFAYGFPDIAAHYVERIFAEVGRPFDLRICVKNLPREAILSTAGIFEDLDHTGIVPLESVHDGELVVERAGPITGLLVWLQLHVDGDHVVDILDNPGSWLPVYLPLDQALDQAGIAARPGDRIRFTVARSLCANGLNPDFTVTGRIERQDAEAVPFRVVSAHFGDGFRASPFYERLFAAGPVPRADAVTPVAVRRHLSRLLPSHAVPAHLVALDALPVTVNGKVDRAALPAPAAPAAASRRDPATPVEQVVLEVWRAILERDDIGVDDDFFGLGGDSIRAIQIVSRLRGLELGAEIRDIFQNPSVAQFAPVVKPLKPRADQGPVSGPVPLAPIQRWFFETVDEDRHHFNQGVLLRATAGFDAGAVRKALDNLWRHHDTLRTVFPAAVDGVSLPDPVILPPEGGPSLTLVELGAEPGTDEDTELAAAADRLHAGFRLETGPLFAALLARGASCDRLLLTAHHLVVDSVSWSILLEDLRTAYAAALAGTVPALPDKTASYRDYTGALADMAGGAGWSGALAYWKTVAPPEPLAILPPGRAAVRMADMASVSGRLDRDTTALLLGPAHRAYGTRTDDLLLSGLALALRRRLDRRRTLVTLESHGREWPAAGSDAAPLPDLTRTVGWFTAHYPFLLESGTDGSGDIGTLVKRVKESLRQVPDRGWSYGLLTRHPAGPGLAPLAGQIGFNFLGAMGGAMGGVMAGGQPDGGFTIDWDAPGRTLGARVRRPHPLDILAMVVDGALTVGLDYDSAVGRETAQGLLDGFLQALAEVARHCVSRSGSEATPSDFTYKGLSLDDLDALLHAD
ncbi:non-ribosomal peptide synthetase [Azospirillum agricola]|uniref:non-ribosomal peptide synthetase n=1 Tax=Azospirillum agricola TaxID=1720247 RepID=UPI000A0EF007|nr:non-ribosomal peptide synthetase [Azospirillum agricola]SMH47742.1 non-ribosomal peptide synthase domain TIGR01720/amino acid adenylation domain-containing protein [Azospirillum lipoferum]